METRKQILLNVYRNLGFSEACVEHASKKTANEIQVFINNAKAIDTILSMAKEAGKQRRN